jgi:hypothetical protein
MIEPVPSVEPDYTRCRALVVMTGTPTGPWQQCSRRPVETRQHGDGKLYRVCRQHKRAKWFLPWTAAYFPVSKEEELDRVRRAMEAAAGNEPPKPKLVR